MNRRVEHAFALSQAVMVLTVIALLGGVIAAVALSSISGSRTSTRQVAAQQATEDAAEIYRQALQAGAATEATGWAIPADVGIYSKLLGGRGEAVEVANLKLPDEMRWDVPGMPAPAMAVRETIDGGRYSRFWQIVRTAGPGRGSDSGQVVAWVRGWIGTKDGTPSSHPIMRRVELRPGGFHQFQLLVDGPINFSSGARINGPVHSNGNGVESGPAISVADGGQVRCEGSLARFTATRGTVGSFPGPCKREDAPARSWPLAEVRQTFAGIEKAAAQVQGEQLNGGVFVIPPPEAANEGATQVRLAGNQIIINNAEARNIGTGVGLLVKHDVLVSGATSGRVTIASQPVGRAGTIRVVGNLETVGATGVIGLFTEGDVVVGGEPVGSQPTCVQRIDAAIVAAGGALTIDRSLRTDLDQHDTAPCGEIVVNGSVASRESPVLSWTWPNGRSAGYATRTYSWNPRLVRQPPPWSPTLGGFSVTEQRPAASSCGTPGPGKAWRSECR